MLRIKPLYNKEKEFRLRWLILVLILFSIVSIKVERLYKKDYDHIAPNCEAGVFCPKWFIALGVFCTVLPLITLFLFMVLLIRAYELLEIYSKRLIDVMKKLELA